MSSCWSWCRRKRSRSSWCSRWSGRRNSQKRVFYATGEPALASDPAGIVNGRREWEIDESSPPFRRHQVEQGIERPAGVEESTPIIRTNNLPRRVDIVAAGGVTWATTIQIDHGSSRVQENVDNTPRRASGPRHLSKAVDGVGRAMIRAGPRNAERAQVDHSPAGIQKGVNRASNGDEGIARYLL